ncbi:adp-ribosylation factor [Vairimorpha apis BRL 01]|uniref:Adp-ribosylation factor n=1 Tax=Vairimorpha apis BRL 01 TaxID=1037528 RepID=T0KXJ7_9MICR|nr:adp-ribosylation factor [Vairimorpha apis BRL 01]
MTFTKLVRKLKQESKQLKIVCIGLDNAGKTTILKNIFNIQTTVEPTFGYSLYRCNYNNQNLHVYDIGGQNIFKEYWNNYFEKCDGIIFVYDLSDTRNYMNDLNKIINEAPGIPILVLGNKSDLIINYEKPTKNTNIFKFSIVSGIDRSTLTEPFDWLIHKCKNNLNLQ